MSRIGFGIMGGWNQSQAHAQFVANVVDFNMNVQMALESARFTKAHFRRLRRADGEPGRRRGTAGADAARPYYHADGRVFGRDGERRSGDARRQTRRQLRRSDPRTDGAAIPEQPPVKPLPASTVK